MDNIICSGTGRARLETTFPHFLVIIILQARKDKIQTKRNANVTGIESLLQLSVAEAQFKNFPNKNLLYKVTKRENQIRQTTILQMSAVLRRAVIQQQHSHGGTLRSVVFKQQSLPVMDCIDNR